MNDPAPAAPSTPPLPTPPGDASEGGMAAAPAAPSPRPAGVAAPAPALVYAALVGVQVAFASLAIAGKVILPTLGADALALARIGAGAVAFMAVALARRAPLALPRAELVRIAGLAVLGVVVNQILFLRGLARTSAINASVLSTTIPVFTVAVGLLARRERARLPLVAGVALSLGGALYLIGAQAFHLGAATATGDLLVVVNCLSYALFLLLARGVLHRRGTVPVLAWAFTFGALMVAPLGAADLARVLPHLSPRLWLVLAHVVAVPTVFAYLANTWALRHAPSAVVAIFIYLQPMAAAALAVPLLGERPAPRVLLAGALIFAGIALVTRRPAAGR